LKAARLSERDDAILRSIVEGYVTTARPVSSGVIAGNGVVSLSSATVRNIMRTLEERGLISQPHTSAGRVPTDRGYRYYVDNLMSPLPLSPDEQARIASCVAALAGHELGAVASKVSRMVSELSRELAVTVAPTAGGLIEHLTLLALDGGGVLAVATSSGGSSRSAVLASDRRVNAADIEKTQALLRAWLHGVPLGDAERVLGTRLAGPAAPMSAAVAELTSDVLRLFAIDDAVQVRYEGARYMFRHPEFHDHASTLGKIIDSEGALAEVVRAPAEPGTVTVRIGHENRGRGLQRMSLVVGSYRVGGGVGRIGVIGPTRMRYQRLVGLVRKFSEALDSVFATRGS
jgi:heat-inducible transcriptional repressor